MKVKVSLSVPIVLGRNVLSIVAIGLAVAQTAQMVAIIGAKVAFCARFMAALPSMTSPHAAINPEAHSHWDDRDRRRRKHVAAITRYKNDESVVLWIDCA